MSLALILAILSIASGKPSPATGPVILGPPAPITICVTGGAAGQPTTTHCSTFQPK